jgi:hypothetical protein
MSKRRRKKRAPKRVLALPDLEQAKTAVLNSLTSKSGQRTYDCAITDFVGWYCSEPRLAFNRTVVLRYRIYLEQKLYAPTTINLRLAAVRRVAHEAADSGTAQPGACGRHPTGQRSSPDWCPCWELAQRRAGQAASVRCRPRFPARQEELRDPRHADWVWTAPRRVARPARRVHTTPGGALGNRRPSGQGGTHPHRSRSRVGERRDRRMEGSGQHHAGRPLPINQQGRPSLGQWNDPEGCCGRSSGRPRRAQA